MKLMGHSDIKTTMRYVELSAQDVRKEFLRVLKLRNRNRTEDDDASGTCET